jgi:hypothetical protein
MQRDLCIAIVPAVEKANLGVSCDAHNPAYGHGVLATIAQVWHI